MKISINHKKYKIDYKKITVIFNKFGIDDEIN